MLESAPRTPREVIEYLSLDSVLAINDAAHQGGIRRMWPGRSDVG